MESLLNARRRLISFAIAYWGDLSMPLMGVVCMPLFQKARMVHTVNLDAGFVIAGCCYTLLFLLSILALTVGKRRALRDFYYALAFSGYILSVIDVFVKYRAISDIKQSLTSICAVIIFVRIIIWLYKLYDAKRKKAVPPTIISECPEVVPPSIDPPV